MRLELGDSGGFQHGVFFDLIAKQSCQVKCMWVLADGPATLTLRACEGGWEASASDPSKWAARGEVHVPLKDEETEETKLVFEPPIEIHAGEQLGLYLHGPSQYSVAFTSSSREPTILENEFLTVKRGRHTRSSTPFDKLWSGATFYFPAGSLELVAMLANQEEVRSELQDLATGMKSENTALKAELQELRAGMEQLKAENTGLQEIRADLEKLKTDNATLAAGLREERAARACSQTRAYEVRRFGRSAALHEAEQALEQAEANLSKKKEALGKLKEVVALGIAVTLDDAQKQCDEAEVQIQCCKKTVSAEKESDDQACDSGSEGKRVSFKH